MSACAFSVVMFHDKTMPETTSPGNFPAVQTTLQGGENLRCAFELNIHPRLSLITNWS